MSQAVAEKVQVLQPLTPQQREAALAKVEAFFAAWERQCWGTLASHCQLPQSIGNMESDICIVLERRLGDHHLTSFIVGDVVTGHGEARETEAIAFADVSVIATVIGLRIGILTRVIFDGKSWGVNFTSINRRFDPDEQPSKGESHGS